MRRIDQWLANLGYCSRREARAWLDAGRVKVRGIQSFDTGEKVASSDLLIDDQALDHPEGIFLLLHKPVGLVCSHEAKEGPSVYDLLPERWRKRNPVVTTVGRLDKETSGALLLTDQSAVVHRLTSPKQKVPKIYLVTVAHPLKPELGEIFSSGQLFLAGEQHPCEPATFRPLTSTTAELILTEGRYHQVRRMFASQGYEVIALHRSHFGPYDVADLVPGTWKELPLI